MEKGKDFDKQRTSETFSNQAKISIEAIKVTEGRCYFANTKEFFDMLKLLENKRDDDYSAIEKKLGITSLRTYNEKLAKDSSQIRFKELNFSPQVALLLNQEGEIQIGDTIMFYHNNTQYFILKDKAKYIKSFKQGLISNSEQQDVILLKREIKPFEKKNLSAVTTNGRIEAYPLYIGQNVSFIHISPTYHYGGHQYRIVFEIGHSYQPGYGASYSEFYTQINVEYLKKSIWGDYYVPAGENTDRLIYNLNANGYAPGLYYPNNIFSISNFGAQSFNSSQSLRRTLSSTFVGQPCANNNCEWTINSFIGDYTGRIYNSSNGVIGSYRVPNLQF
jgi:hypothetical protein